MFNFLILSPRFVHFFQSFFFLYFRLDNLYWFVYLSSLTFFSVIFILLLIPSKTFLFQMLHISVLEFSFGSFWYFLFLCWECLSFHSLWASLWSILVYSSEKYLFFCINKHLVWIDSSLWWRQLSYQFIFSLTWDPWVFSALVWFRHQPEIWKVYTQNLGFPFSGSLLYGISPI